MTKKIELTKKQLTKLVQFATSTIHSSFTWESEAEDTVDDYLKAINYTRCCESDSEQLVCNQNELDCPFDFTSRCTMGRCNCKPKAN